MESSLNYDHARLESTASPLHRRAVDSALAKKYRRHGRLFRGWSVARSPERLLQEEKPEHQKNQCKARDQDQHEPPKVYEQENIVVSYKSPYSPSIRTIPRRTARSCSKRSALAPLSTNTRPSTSIKEQPSLHSAIESQPSNTRKSRDKALDTRQGYTPRKVLWPAEHVKSNTSTNKRIPIPAKAAHRSDRYQVFKPQRGETPSNTARPITGGPGRQHNSPGLRTREKKTSYTAERYRPKYARTGEWPKDVVNIRVNVEGAQGKHLSRRHVIAEVTPPAKRPEASEHFVERNTLPSPAVDKDDPQVSSKTSSSSGISRPTVSHPPSLKSVDPSIAITPSTSNNSEHNLVQPATKPKAREMKRWEIWIFRIVLGLIVAVVNISLLMVYLFAPQHHYLFAFLIIIKSKDLLSTIAGIVGMSWSIAHGFLWPPGEVDSKWILSLVCAYAETEDQIMKTVKSLINQDLVQHRQVICVILDGKPREVLSHFTSVSYTTTRPYETWKGVSNELQIHAGMIDGTPVLLIQKIENAGKKDTLILGHSLFNYLREDLEADLKALRHDIFTDVLPALTGLHEFKSFDYVYATDADSNLFKDCLRELANALARNTKAIAACGIVIAELDSSTEWSAWHLFQQYQYTFGQCIRRQAESVWGRVTCCPGPVTMVSVRPEMGKAISDYIKPIESPNLFLHQVQYQGTDRRLTWCMLSQDKNLQSILVTSAIGETVVPETLNHYLSQRRRWAANAYFNDYMYAVGKEQHFVTRLFAMVDIVRMSFVYYRVMNTVLFVRSLTRNFYFLKILPTLITTKSPTAWFFLITLIREPVMRKRIHKIICGMLLNQIMSPFLSIVIFTKVLLNLGNHAWGVTGVSSKDTRAATVEPIAVNVPISPWSPRRLASIVRTAIHRQTPKKQTTLSQTSSQLSTLAHTTSSSTTTIVNSSENLQTIPETPIPKVLSGAALSTAVTPIQTPSASIKGQNQESTIRKRNYNKTPKASLLRSAFTPSAKPIKIAKASELRQAA